MGVMYKLGSELGSKAPNDRRAASGHIDQSRLIPRFTREPAKGFEPLTCCLRNVLSRFRGVRSYSPIPKYSPFAKMPVHSHPGEIVRVGVVVGVVLGQRWVQNRENLKQSSAIKL